MFKTMDMLNGQVFYEGNSKDDAIKAKNENNGVMMIVCEREETIHPIGKFSQTKWNIIG